MAPQISHTREVRSDARQYHREVVTGDCTYNRTANQPTWKSKHFWPVLVDAQGTCVICVIRVIRVNPCAIRVIRVIRVNPCESV